METNLPENEVCRPIAMTFACFILASVAKLETRDEPLNNA
jgi:hypothetical protein